ncbi:UMF1 family MFS transporter [Halanaerobium sp. MA284_MarDTE_T2]|nr:UMF1 family MFS transporter [Halanaerobium sp. MA284_MarDTE_T2]
MLNNKKSVYSWVIYDWANSAFAATVLAAVLPIFYKDVAAAHLAPHIATSYWGYTQTAAMIIIAVLSPVLGAAADYSDSKKSFLKFFVFLGTSATAVLFFVERGNYIAASLLFITANIGFAGGNVFYDGFLTDIASDENIDCISSLGYAAGYLGGGILLAINLLMISRPQLFCISDSIKAVRISFVTVAVWWLLFSIPAFVNLPSSRNIVKKISFQEQGIISFKRLKNTFRNIKKYRELWKFLLAFWLYNDGIGTIIRMAAIYGREIGIGQSDLIGALLLTQFIGIPFALLFGRMGQHFGAKKGIFAALTIYIFVQYTAFFSAQHWISGFLLL